VWGTHGIGKTESVIAYAQEKGYKWIYCAPAQFEEMGDLHGIPEVFNPTPDQAHSGQEYTVYRQPAWLKEVIDSVDEGEPGLFILDDFNRADERIIQGCMQLLQLHKLFSWSLPPRWQIVLTANPEGGPYQVTELDEAMLTRMLHVSLTFDAPCWAKWALSEGLDPRGVEFLLTYPHLINNKRTTPRSFTQFLRQVGDLPDYKSDENVWLTRVIGEGTIDSHVVDDFLHFMAFEQEALISPEELLNAKTLKALRALLKVFFETQGVKRHDLVATLCQRLSLYVTSPNYQYKALHKRNFLELMLSEHISPALRFQLHGAITNAPQGPNAPCAPLIRDPKLSEAIMEAL
jgi:MoxR-like ATPase